MAKGTLYIISAPSGAGKTSLVAELVKRHSDIAISISHTTRPKRDVEGDGVNYHFINREAFEKMVTNGDFLEYANVFGNYYGTSRQHVITLELNQKAEPQWLTAIDFMSGAVLVVQAESANAKIMA